jgi:hypothetical protein
MGILSFLWFRLSWNYGLQYQGFRYTLITALGSSCFAMATGTILAASERTDSFARSLATNFLIFAWAVTYAFPYLGELP